VDALHIIAIEKKKGRKKDRVEREKKFYLFIYVMV
jgi:hypothetical protein